MYILYGVLPILVGLLIGYLLFERPSKKLRKAVDDNRNCFVGKTKDEISELLGVKPEKVENIEDGILCTFGAGNFYNIQMKFDNNNMFVKITSERNSNYSIRGNN